MFIRKTVQGNRNRIFFNFIPVGFMPAYINRQKY